MRDRIAHCVEDAIVSGDSAEERAKIAELMDVLRRMASDPCQRMANETTDKVKRGLRSAMAISGISVVATSLRIKRFKLT